MEKTPRIERVAVRGPTTLRIKWRGGPADDIDLAGWIATGGEILGRLRNPDVFAKRSVHGTPTRHKATSLPRSQCCAVPPGAIQS